MASHFREFWLFGLFFAIVTPLQLLWAETVRRRADDRRVLAIGAVGNLAVVVLWAFSRVFGLPLGPDRFQAEAIGIKDVLATTDELALVALVAILLVDGRERPTRGWAPVVTWSLVAMSLLVALVGGGHGH